MAIAADFKGLVEPKKTLAAPASNSAFASIIRDQLQITSWLAIGGIAQGIALLLIGRTALLLPATLLAWRVLDAFMQAQGLKANPQMDGVIHGKFSAQMPAADGSFGNKPADGEVTVLLLGFKSNHALQMLAPDFRETGSYFASMMQDLDAHRADNGYLGASSWLGMGERATANSAMTLFYFRSVQHLHAWAHGPVHRDGWNWWNRTVKQHPHLSIWHEVFRAPSGNWESIYVNAPPTGLSATMFKGVSGETGEDVWNSPIVDARKGLLKTSAGRMSRSQAGEHDEYNDDPYQNQA